LCWQHCRLLTSNYNLDEQAKQGNKAAKKFPKFQMHIENEKKLFKNNIWAIRLSIDKYLNDSFDQTNTPNTIHSAFDMIFLFEIY